MGYKKTNLDFTLLGNDDVNNATKIAYLFDSLTDVKEFSLDVYKQSMASGGRGYNFLRNYVDESSRRQFARGNGLTFYGTQDFDWVDKTLNRFFFIDQVGSEIDKLNQKIQKKDFVDIDQVKRIEFTEKEVGVFSFDLASLGLIRVYEYYSPLLKANVSPNLVKSEKGANGVTLYYYVGTPYIPKHEIKYVADKEGYYSEILKRRVNKEDLIIEEGVDKLVKFFYPEQLEIEKHEVDRKQATDKNGQKKFATTFKKCFIYIKRVDNTLPRIDIIVPIGYSSGITPIQAFWNTIQILAICEKLSKSNVNYRIIGAISSNVGSSPNNVRIYKFINLKNENQTLDPNAIALVTSDMRFYRLDGFFLKQATQYDSGFESKMYIGISNPITDSVEIKEAYIDFLSKSTSQTDRDASKLPDSKIVLDYALNEAQALIGYDKAICTISGGKWNDRTNQCEKK